MLLQTSFRELLLSPVDSRSDADRFQQLQQRARSLGEQQQNILDRAVELEIIGADEAELCASTSKQSVASPTSMRSKVCLGQSRMKYLHAMYCAAIFACPCHAAGNISCHVPQHVGPGLWYCA